MQIEARGRQQGKTNEAIKWLRENEYAVLFVMDEHERRRVLDLYFDEDDRPKFENRIVVADGEAARRMRGTMTTVGYVDNLDIILFRLLGVMIEKVTITEEPEW